jgi:trimeric autotransporter adhesin
MNAMSSRIFNLRNIVSLCLLIVLSASPTLADSRRIEENDKSISYSGNWFSNDSSSNSGGRSVLTNTRGARATISFTGTGIRWIGVKDQWSGVANVYLDGTMNILDTFGESNAYQQEVYHVSGLEPGRHTLSIEVTHERATARTGGSWVWIDAFEIEDGEPVPGGLTAAAGRVEEDDPALAYTGHWYPNSSVVHSGSSARLAMDAGSSVSLTFNGSGIFWIAYRDEWSGMARVFLDGEEKTTIDLYRSPGAARVVPFSIDNLNFDRHTLRIEVTGTHDENAKGSWVWLDGFDVIQ